MLRSSVVLGCLLLLAPVLRAQDAAEEKPCVVLGRLLQRARDTGALERVLGERHFLETHSFVWLDAEGKEERRMEYPKVLSSVRGRLLDATGAAPMLEVRFTNRSATHSGPVRYEITWTIGLLDGRIHASRWVGGAQPETGRLEADGWYRGFVHVAGEEHCHGSFEWVDEHLPTSVTEYVLPCLFDQGLPPVLRTFVIHGPVPAQNPRFTFRLLPDEGSGRRSLTREHPPMAGERPDRRSSFVIHVSAADGRVLEITERGGHDWPAPGDPGKLFGERRVRPVSEDELARLEAEVSAQPAPSPAREQPR